MNAYQVQRGGHVGAEGQPDGYHDEPDETHVFVTGALCQAKALPVEPMRDAPAMAVSVAARMSFRMSGCSVRRSGGSGAGTEEPPHHRQPEKILRLSRARVCGRPRNYAGACR